MDQLQNHRLRGILTLVGILLAIFLAAESWKVVRDITRTDLNEPTISVSGEGRVFVKPDLGKISVGVTSEQPTAEAAEKRTNEAANKIFEALKAKGVEEKDIKTTNYSISPMYDYDKGRQRLRGYQVSQSFEVKIRDLAKAGEIIAAASAAGANQVSGLSFTTEDPERIQAEARAKAIEHARQKAEELAGKLGVRLGKVTSFYESGPTPIFYERALLGKGGDGAGAPAPVVPTGENEVVVTVTVGYQIK